MARQTTTDDAAPAAPTLTRNELRTARAGANLWAGDQFRRLILELRRMPITPEARTVYREVLANYLRVVSEALVAEEGA